jgi:hypothetical protein
MTAPFNISAAWANIAGNGTLTATSAASAMPITLLQQKDVIRHWRSAPGNSQSFTEVYLTNQSADTFDILGTNLTAAGIVRVRLFPTSADAAANTNVIWDSNPTSAAGQVDPLYEDAVILAPSVMTGWKAVKVDLTDTSLTYIEGGYLFISTRTQLKNNFDYGHQFYPIDPCEQKKTAGGTTNIIGHGPKYRRCVLTVGCLTEAQRWSVFQAIGMTNGRSTPLLLILDPSSSNLGRDTIFGLIQDDVPVASIAGFDGGPMYSAPVTIDELV